jgi:hypothetical protein
MSTRHLLSIPYRTNALRFCLSDGQNWIFALLTKDEKGNRACYESEAFTIVDPTKSSYSQPFKDDVHTVVELVRHWVSALAYKVLLSRYRFVY